MVKKTKVELVGIEDVEMILNQLPSRFQARVITAALKESAKPMHQAAVRNLDSHPWGEGRQVKLISKREKGIPGIEIGRIAPARGKRAEAAWEAMGAYWLEYGTMELMTKPRESRTRSLSEAQRRVGSSTERARIPAIGWLRKAVSSQMGLTEKQYRNLLWKKLNQSLLRHAKKIKWSGTL